jgi:hypothetical protein
MKGDFLGGDFIFPHRPTRRPTCCWASKDARSMSADARKPVGRHVDRHTHQHAGEQSVSIGKSRRLTGSPTCFAKNQHVPSFHMHFTILRFSYSEQIISKA